LNHTVGIRKDGTLWAWGDNSYGVLGDGTITYRSVPVRIGTATNWASVSTGLFHTVAVKADGTLWAWGRNDRGQLGNGKGGGRANMILSPTRIGTAMNWASVYAGEEHTVAVRTDGSLWAWGSNSAGQLGNGEEGRANMILSPTRIGTDNNWASVSAGAFHTVAVRTDGTLWAWGSNQFGQLGNGGGGDGDRSLNPIQVGAAANWASSSVGIGHTLAVGRDGSLWVWGWNQDGQLGDGTTNVRSTPVRIGTDTNWTSVATNQGFASSMGGLTRSFSVATKADGSIWAWGCNGSGQLGNGGGGWGDMSMVPVRVVMP